MAHVGGRYADIKFAHDPMETAVEVHSAWGTFEWIVRDAFEKNYRVGIVGNSDGHKGRPGACYPGASFFGSYGGLTCFLAERLDRDAIFESMRRRRHYATTGNRALLDVAVTTAAPAEVFLRDPAAGPATSEKAQRLLMGDIAKVTDGEVELAIEVIGSAPIERLDIYDGLDLIETVRPYGAGDLGRRVRLVYEGAEYRGRARTTTWDGSLEHRGQPHSAHGGDQQLEPRSRHPEAGRDRLDLEGGDDRQLRRHRPVARRAGGGAAGVQDGAGVGRGGDLRSWAWSRACSRLAGWSGPSSCSGCRRR